MRLATDVFTVTLAVSCLAIAACGGSGTTDSASSTANSTVALRSASEAIAAAPNGTTIQVSATDNVYGIVADGSIVASGGLDGGGNAYSANLLGTSVTWGATNFTLGAPGTFDAVAGGTIALPAGNYASLSLLATAVNGAQLNQPFIVTYADGTSSTFTQSLADWVNTLSEPGQSTAVQMAYRVIGNGATQAIPIFLYGYSFALDSTKTVSSLTLPNNRNVVLLAMDLIPIGGVSSSSSSSSSSGSSSSGGGSSGGGSSGGSSSSSSSSSGSSSSGVARSGGSSRSSSGGTSGGGSVVADTSNPVNSTFVQGTPVTLTFTLNGSTATAVNLAIVDEQGNSVASASVPVVSGAATYTASSSKLGYYQVNFALPDGTTNAMLGTRPAGFITYAVVPDPATRVNYGDELSHFGMEGGFATTQGAIIPFLGIRYILSSAGSWASLEPGGAGQFAAAYAAAKAAGQQYPPQNPAVNAVTYNDAPWPTFSIAQITTANMPGWAGPLSGTAGSQCHQFGALNPAGVAGLPGFASALATETAADYSAQTRHYYQVTWEPEFPWCYGGTPAELVQYFQLVYSQIHAADPKAYVMGPTIFPGDNGSQTAALYTAGLGTVVDAFSIHPYYQYNQSGIAGLPEANGIVAKTRAEITAATAAVGHAVPMVGTESAFNSGAGGNGGTASPLYEALGNVRENLILIGEGYSVNLTFYPADFWNSSPTETGNLYGYYYNLDPAIAYGTDKLGPKPSVPAYAAMTYFIDGSTSQGPVSGLTGTQIGYRFSRGGITTLALWDYQAASSALTLTTPAENIQLCDWMGNCTNTTSSGQLQLTLGASPLYIIGQGL